MPVMAALMAVRMPSVTASMIGETTRMAAAIAVAATLMVFTRVVPKIGKM